MKHEEKCTGKVVTTGQIVRTYRRGEEESIALDIAKAWIRFKRHEDQMKQATITKYIIANQTTAYKPKLKIPHPLAI